MSVRDATNATAPVCDARCDDSDVRAPSSERNGALRLPRCCLLFHSLSAAWWSGKTSHSNERMHTRTHYTHLQCGELVFRTCHVDVDTTVIVVIGRRVVVVIVVVARSAVPAAVFVEIVDVFESVWHTLLVRCVNTHTRAHSSHVPAAHQAGPTRRHSSARRSRTDR
jgi:hypothetical protein